MERSLSYRCLSLFACLSMFAGCKTKTLEATETSSALEPARTSTTKPSRRTQLRSYRPLLDEVGRAELDAGGLLVDLGAPDQHKYTRGGWRTGWGDSGADDHATWAVLDAKQGFLEILPPATAPKEIVFRARSRAKQRLSWFVNGRELGSADVGKEWSVNRVPVKDDAFRGGRPIRIEVRAANRVGDRGRADIDWLWLAAAGGEPILSPRVLPLGIGGATRRSLASPSARAYAYYLEPPPNAELVVDLGATERATFVITATTDDGQRRELLRETVARSWREHVVALGELAGQALRLELSTTEQQGAAGWGEPEIMVARANADRAAPGGKRPRNVIVLVVDTARADAFGPFARPDRVVKTPSYDALAARSTVFTAAYNNENWTKPSIATSLSGLYPSSHGAKEDASKLSPDVELLGERLKREGFATAGFVANGYVSSMFGFEQGWDVFRNYIREDKPSEAEHVFADALAWHAAHAKRHSDRPFFLYVQTIDPHVPYDVDREFWSAYFDGKYDGPLGSSIEAEGQRKLSSNKLAASKRDVEWLRALYWGEIAYHDAHFGKFIAELEARNVLDDTLLVVTNDHGEELGERGLYGHGHQVFEEMIRAPLLIHYPPMFASGRAIADIVEHVDLAPTILDILGREPLRDPDGISLLPLLQGLPTQQPHYAMTEFLQTRRVLRVGPWKLFGRPAGGGALFDLATDPDERHELGAAPIARRLCEVHLGEALAIPNKAKRLSGMASRRRFRAGEVKIGPRMRRQLEALGYIAADPKSAKDGDEK
jgi:arylsulfatase A-like enzyme